MHRPPLPFTLCKIAALLLTSALWNPALLRADVASALSFTDFPNANVNALADGQVMQARGGLIDFQRGITAQSLYLIDAPLQTVRTKLLTWNPATHSELKVWMHLSLPAHPTVADFGALQSLPDNSSVNYLINATDKLDLNNPDLQLNKNEGELVLSLRGQGQHGKTLMANAWSQILAGRVSRFLAGNLAGDTYVQSGGNIDSESETKSLLRSDVKVYQRVHPTLAGTPLYASTKSVPVDLYYESFDVEGGAALGTGAVYQSPPGPDGSIMSADVEYYLNYGIYVSIELEQLTPVTVNGKNETMIWRDDLVSTSNIAYLHGTERLASGMIMLQDVKQAVDAFRSEFK